MFKLIISRTYKSPRVVLIVDFDNAIKVCREHISKHMLTSEEFRARLGSYSISYNGKVFDGKKQIYP